MEINIWSVLYRRKGETHCFTSDDRTVANGVLAAILSQKVEVISVKCNSTNILPDDDDTGETFNRSAFNLN